MNVQRRGRQEEVCERTGAGEYRRTYVNVSTNLFVHIFMVTLTILISIGVNTE